jgi:predicted DCC family thiol-disulfide oxidoreductase YuxK
LFAGLQIGFNSSMRLGLFGMIAITITIGLLPSSFWDNGFNRFTTWIQKKGKSGLVIYYDYECTFCYKMTFLLKRLLALNTNTEIHAAHENPEIEKIMLERNSWVVTDTRGIHHTGFDGVITVFAYSPLFFWKTFFLKLKPVRYIGEIAYRAVANNRKQICVPEPQAPALTREIRAKNIIVAIIVSVLLIYVIGWNIDTLGLSNQKVITPNIEGIGWFTHLDQKFNMFAPTPLTEDGWYVYPGTLRDGTEVDVYDGASPVSYQKPVWIAYRYPNQRWQKYLMNLWSKDFSEYRLGYGKYLCRQWNNSHPANKQLMTFNMVFMLQNTPAPGTISTPVVPTTIWQHHCF